MKSIVKQCLPYAAIVAAFMVISAGYFMPALFKGETLHQMDVRKGAGMGRDLAEYYQENGEKSLWSSRMFSGMPSYQISPSYKATPIFTKLRRTFEGWLPAPASYIFAYMLGFFILLMAFKVKPWVAVIGAIAYAFSSYFIIIIGAGHIWKVFVLELIPPTLAGIVWTYRGKYLLGGVITSLFLAMQLASNHVQMTYYFSIFAMIFVAGRLIYNIRKKQLHSFLKACGVLAIAAILSIGANAANIIFSQKYAKQTTRGQSELTDNSKNKTKGLDRDYVTQWSYGIGETFTLLVPNVQGGSSGPIGYSIKNGKPYRDQKLNKSALNRVINPQHREYLAGKSGYCGYQPFTSGPVYVGAFIVFLFVFGLFAVKGYMKWTLLAGTILSILLAWGENFMWFTDIFLDYFPMYNKFRAVSSALVIAELTVPILATLTLAKIIENYKIINEKRKPFLISLGLTAGIAFLFIILPALLFNFSTTYDTKSLIDDGVPNDMIYKLIDELKTVRIGMLQSDAWRSIIIILIGAGLLWMYSKKKIKKAFLITIIAGLVLFDLASIDKRYLNGNDFVPKAETQVAWEMTKEDKIILEDKDPNYRVLNLSVSTFNDASTSFYHKSIGGYHAAKLRRYQELIDKYILLDVEPAKSHILNMLNTRYIITPNKQVALNFEALGNAWFVDSLYIVGNADEEIDALATINTKTTAVADIRFSRQLAGFTPQHDETATIKLTDYKINDIKYKTETAVEQLAVFSEIYYDDGLTRWEAFIDGQLATPIRVNYVLRALLIPAGEHNIEFIFKPISIYTTLNNISLASVWIILLLALGAILLEVKRAFYKK